MNIELVKLTSEYRDQLVDMINEWKADIEKNHTNSSPKAIFKNDCNDFDYYLENLEIKEKTEDGLVPNSVYFCLDRDRNIFVGAVDIRHCLNDYLAKKGGHIGDGVRPSERQKGYATAMISLALEECKKIGLNKVLMICEKDNIASAKSIENNGGIFESLIEYDNCISRRYWITLFEETIETERLILRRNMPSDYIEMSAWTQDERVYKYLLSNPRKDPEEVMHWLQTKDPNSKTGYIMIMHSKADDHAVGVVGAFYDAENDAWEIAYNVKYDDWGKGYASEGIKGLIQYLKEHNGAHRIVGECAKENTGSAGVMKKIGMKFERSSKYSKDDETITFDSDIYSMDI